MEAFSLALGAAASGAPFELALAGISTMALGAGALIAFGVILIFLGLQRAIDARSRALSRRFADAGVVVPVGPEAQQRRSGRRQGGRRAPVETDPTRNSAYRLASELAQADLRITVGEYQIMRAVLASLGALIGLAAPLSTITGRVLLALVLLIAGLFGPGIWVNRRRKARADKFNEQLPDVINLMAGALRTGYAFMQALELVSREGPEPTRTEFARVVQEVGIGISPDEALTHLVDRMQSEDLNLLVTAVNVQREVGGNLVEVLEVIATTIRERIKLIGEVGVLTAQQQLSGYIIAALPVGLGLLLFIISPDYMLSMFTLTHWFGYALIGCSGVMVLMGLIIIRRIVDIKV